MFTLDSSLHFIDAAEPDVIALYRSTSSATAAPPGGKVQSYEAVVCAIGKESEADVYMALLDVSAKQMLVYVPGTDHAASGSYNDTLKEALGFAESLGFSMESVNLNYSKALREVIIRNIRVFQPLQDQKKIAQGKSAAARRVERQVAGEKTSVKKSEAERLAEEAASNRGRELEKLEHAELKRLLAEKTAAEASAAEQARETMLAWEKAEKERSERELLVAEVAAARKRAEAHAEEARQARGKADAERAERERILAEKADTEKRAAEQAEAARLALERAEAERAELERILTEKTEAEQRAAEREEAARLAMEKAEAERVEREKALAERAEADRSPRSSPCGSEGTPGTEPRAGTPRCSRTAGDGPIPNRIFSRSTSRMVM
jgi:hypothetical protein